MTAKSATKTTFDPRQWVHFLNRINITGSRDHPAQSVDVFVSCVWLEAFGFKSFQPPCAEGYGVVAFQVVSRHIPEGIA